MSSLKNEEKIESLENNHTLLIYWNYLNSVAIIAAFYYLLNPGV